MNQLQLLFVIEFIYVHIKTKMLIKTKQNNKFPKPCAKVEAFENLILRAQSKN